MNSTSTKLFELPNPFQNQTIIPNDLCKKIMYDDCNKNLYAVLYSYIITVECPLPKHFDCCHEK